MKKYFLPLILFGLVGCSSETATDLATLENEEIMTSTVLDQIQTEVTETGIGFQATETSDSGDDDSDLSCSGEEGDDSVLYTCVNADSDILLTSLQEEFLDGTAFRGQTDLTALCDATTNDPLEHEQVTTLNYTGFVTTSCSSEVTLQGEFTRTETTSLARADLCSESGSATAGADTIVSATSATCSGLTVTSDTTSYDVGFTITQTRPDADSPATDYSGTICIDGVSTDFDSLEELETTLDPEQVCNII